MSVKSVRSTSKAGPNSRGTDQKISENIHVARIASSTTIHATRTQVVCTIICSLLAVLGIVIANLDKFTGESPKIANKLLIESKVERVKDFIEKNNQDAQEMERVILSKKNVPNQIREKTRDVLDTYNAANRELHRQFISEQGRLNLAIATSNDSALEISKQRINRLPLEDASNLQEVLNKVGETLSQPNINAKQDREKSLSEDMLLDVKKFLKRKPVLEVAELLPIKLEIDPSQERILAFNGDTKTSELNARYRQRQTNPSINKPSNAIAEKDRSVRGKRIDIWTPTGDEAIRFGRRKVKLTVLSLPSKRTSTVLGKR